MISTRGSGRLKTPVLTTHQSMMPSPRRSTIRSLGALALGVVIAQSAEAQAGRTVTVQSDDSVSFVVPRRAVSGADVGITTRDGRVALILRDTVVVMQLTDYGMDHLFDSDSATRVNGEGEGIIARMARAGVSGLLDHGIAYRVSALRDAYADGSRVVLEDYDGKHVFEETNYNGHHPMEEIAPTDARFFAARVKRAIGSVPRRAAVTQLSPAANPPLRGIAAEAAAFMNAYAEDLRKGDRAAIAVRYHRAGVYQLLPGVKRLVPYDTIVAQYANRWRPPVAFEWRDLSYEVVGPNTVAVVGLFAWSGGTSGQPALFSYSSVLERQDGVLRIRIEAEAGPR